VPNKFPALRREGEPEQSGEILYQTMSGTGAHEVIIEASGHDQTLASLPSDSVERVLKAYASRLLDLKKDPRLEYVIIFKNHGPSAGATLEHTHSQLIGLPIVPTHVLAEMEGALSHRESTGRCIYCDIISRELSHATRIVTANEHFTALCPFASPFPFETWILPKKHTPRFETSAEHFPALAAILSDLLRRINAVLGEPDYNFVIHTAPLRDNNVDHYHWHLELIPKLNHVAGFEWGSSFFINPTPPEEAASFLREAGQEA
jgi:UDPglucose--hexose-1-phosphate uridylyltransferase